MHSSTSAAFAAPMRAWATERSRFQDSAVRPSIVNRQYENTMFYKLAIITVVSLVLITAGTAHCKTRSLRKVENLDLEKYSGTWFEVARLPNYFERNCSSEITAKYSLRPDGQIDVRNSCKKKCGSVEVAQGIGKTKEPNSKIGHLKVTFAPGFLRAIPFVWADYCVIDVDNDYKFALVGDPSRKYLWILSRDQHMDETNYSRLVQLAADEGFDVSKLIKLGVD